MEARTRLDDAERGRFPFRIFEHAGNARPTNEILCYRNVARIRGENCRRIFINFSDRRFNPCLPEELTLKETSVGSNFSPQTRIDSLLSPRFPLLPHSTRDRRSFSRRAITPILSPERKGRFRRKKMISRPTLSQMKIINSLRSREGKAAFPRMYVPFHSFYEEMLKRCSNRSSILIIEERERESLEGFSFVEGKKTRPVVFPVKFQGDV